MFRKTKKGLVAVALTLSLSSVMAAMSYSSASVTSDMSVKLTDTSKALLALSTGDHNAAYYHDVTSDILKINLSRGIDDKEFGVQPYSVYEWDDLFQVTNNSENEVTVTIETKDKQVSGGMEIFAKAEGSWTRLLNDSGSPGTSVSFTLKKGESQWIDIKTDAQNGNEKVTKTDLIISAE